MFEKLKSTRVWTMGLAALGKLKSYRLWVMGLAAIAVILLYLATDPFGGSDTAMRLQSLAWITVCVAPTYWIRRALAGAARGREAYAEALRGNIAAGLVYAGLCVLGGLLFLGVALASRAIAAEPPAAARPYLPTLRAEQLALWPDHPAPAVLGALVEQETCPSLTHRKCWSPHAELKTSREYGFGLGQTTISYKKDGRVRFDRWSSLRTEHREQLAGWTWANRYDARMQLRAIVLDNRSCYAWATRLVRSSEPALAFCDSAYNGGRSGVLSDIRLCSARAGCDPHQWFGNVEHTSTKSRERWHGYGASAFEINRAHVRAVMITRRGRYIDALPPTA